MSQTLPSRSPDAVRLADVLTSSYAANRGEPNPLGLNEVTSSIVVLVDGLGLGNLKARAGHARTLMSAVSKTSVATSTFPSTTAAALTSLTTGAAPGEHGITGYSVYRPALGRTMRQIQDWGPQMPAATWQRLPTVFERAGLDGFRADAIGAPKYAGSGFSDAVLRGATYFSAPSIAERLELALERSRTPGLSYVYLAELDMAGHAHGWQSTGWLARLEEFDAALQSVRARLPKRVGVIVTADHGMIDIAPSAQVDLDRLAPELISTVRGISGDPRALALWIDPGMTAEDRSGAARQWRDALGEKAWVLSREQAIESELYGAVHPDVVDRIGDVLLIARKAVAFYDGRTATAKSREMIGQHGALSDEEVRVPLLRFGAFASLD